MHPKRFLFSKKPGSLAPQKPAGESTAMKKLVLSTVLPLSLSGLACAGSDTQIEEPTVEPAPTPAETEPAPETSAAVSPIPEGMHSANPNLVVDDVAAALSFYENAFGAQKGLVLTAPDGSVIHGEITIGDTLVMVSAAMPEMGIQSPKGLSGTNGSLYYYVQDVDAVAKAAIEAGAKEIQPLQNMFYGDRVMTLEDPSGHRWMLATHVEDVSPEILKERTEKIVAAMGQKKKTAMPKFEPKTPATNYRGEMAVRDVTMSLIIDKDKGTLDFYKNALGMEELYRTALPDGRILHAAMSYGDSYLFLSHAFPEMPGHDYYKPAAELGGNALNLMLYTEDVDKAFAKALEAGATKKAPITKMFWGDRYGKIADPSGIEWGMGTHVEDVSDEEMPQRMQEWMQQMGGAHQEGMTAGQAADDTVPTEVPAGEAAPAAGDAKQ